MNRSKEIGPIDKRYKKLQKIGEGTYGDVFLAKDKSTGQSIALKKMKTCFFDEGIPSTAIREISTLKEIEHESVVR
jgi:serine/threonine protein kinase